jgi:hypothetical protein
MLHCILIGVIVMLLVDQHYINDELARSLLPWGPELTAMAASFFVSSHQITDAFQFIAYDACSCFRHNDPVPKSTVGGGRLDIGCGYGCYCCSSPTAQIMVRAFRFHLHVATNTSPLAMSCPCNMYRNGCHWKHYGAQWSVVPIPINHCN